MPDSTSRSSRTRNYLPEFVHRRQRVASKPVQLLDERDLALLEGLIERAVARAVDRRLAELGFDGVEP